VPWTIAKACGLDDATRWNILLIHLQGLAFALTLRPIVINIGGRGKLR